MSDYQADLVAMEKPDLGEASSTRFLAVPFTLWLALVGFGITYLSLQTGHARLADGDKRSPAPVAAAPGTVDPKLGATIYQKNCQACHQATGTGMGSAFPPLAGSEWVLGDEATVSAIVLHGINGEIEVRGKTFKGVMPPFKSRLKPDEIAAVISHVRQTWGNQAPPVTTATVESVLSQTADRSAPWAGGVELKEQSWKK